GTSPLQPRRRLHHFQGLDHLLLSFLTEGVYTYSVEVEVAVNGVSRTLKVEKAPIGDQELPLKMVFAREPAMVHEEFTEYPHTRWLPGPRPEM
ncbi:hypothetical protein, partial [Micrococcus luteus]|uniref:hypothetical protein n=1 Tax=Micrococcus luteus TaxID=1270 RepID=UPI001C52B651